MEIAGAHNIVQEVKQKTGLDKILVVQPFGRGVQNANGMIVDPTSRSFAVQDIMDIIEKAKNDYGVIVMAELPLPLSNKTAGLVAQPKTPDLRLWAAIIELSDHFLGCDSLGQHFARALDKTATVVTGSTYPINVSYPDCKDFDIIDAGADRRTYSPIRISMEDELERTNDQCMDLSDDQKQQILKSVYKRLGASKKFQNFNNESTESGVVAADFKEIK
jgi:hypothetical protein